MELLVATLAHTTKGNHEDALTRVRLVVDTVKKAPGIIHVRFYTSRESDAYYLSLAAGKMRNSGRRHRNATILENCWSIRAPNYSQPRLSNG